MTHTPQTLAVLGASDNPNRYAYRAIAMALAAGMRVIPINPRVQEIQGVAVVKQLADLSDPIDILTIYLGAARSTPLIEAIIQLKPKHVIINPGAENPELEQALDQAEISWEHACTLVLLSTGQF